MANISCSHAAQTNISQQASQHFTNISHHSTTHCRTRITQKIQFSTPPLTPLYNSTSRPLYTITRLSSELRAGLLVPGTVCGAV